MNIIKYQVHFKKVDAIRENLILIKKIVKLIKRTTKLILR